MIDGLITFVWQLIDQKSAIDFTNAADRLAWSKINMFDAIIACIISDMSDTCNPSIQSNTNDRTVSNSLSSSNVTMIHAHIANAHPDPLDQPWSLEEMSFDVVGVD